MLGCSALLASCTAKHEPKEDAPPVVKGITPETPVPKETPPAKADPREITFHVEGMSERLKLM